MIAQAFAEDFERKHRGGKGWWLNRVFVDTNEGISSVGMPSISYRVGQALLLPGQRDTAGSEETL
ncbi:MAG: hypothetical protein OXD34_04620 [bacterium]|nr:hypothetical protein [bacterium]